MSALVAIDPSSVATPAALQQLGDLIRKDLDKWRLMDKMIANEKQPTAAALTTHQ